MHRTGNELAGVLQRSNDESVKFKYIRISSNEIASGGTPYNFTVNLGNDCNLDRAAFITPVACVVPNVANNVSVALGNNTFRITAGATAIVYVCPDGYYSLSDLLANIVAYINSILGAGFVVGSIVNNRATLSSGGNLVLTVLNNPMAASLGFLNDVLGTTITASTVPSLSGATVLYIHSSTISNNATYLNTNNNGVNDVNGMFTLPMVKGFGFNESTMFESGNNQKLILGCCGTPVRQLKFTLRVNNGRLYTELTSNLEFILVLKIFYL